VVLLFLPPAVVVSAVLLLVSGMYGLLPVVLAGLPALFGVASGVAMVMTVAGVSPGVDPRRRTGPNDAGGNLGLQASLAFWSTVLLVLPTAAALTVGYLSGSPAGPWLAVAVGIANGGLGGWLLGRAAVGYLTPRLPTVFTRIRYARRESPADHGLLARLEAASQRSEDAAQEATVKQRRARAEARAAG
jgi:ABC-2 type transport system permease protein